MAIAAGSMFGPMAGGLVPMVIANAIFTLLFAASIQLALRGGRRQSALVGVLFALLIVAGQGYVQIGFALTAPVFAIVFVDRTGRWRQTLREFALAAGLGILIAGPLLVPLAHNWSEIAKDGDVTFARAQPLAFLPLNLVINDVEFYLGEALHKQPYPEFYLIFIGWIAVALALVGISSLVRRGQVRLLAFLCVYVVLIFWIASAIPFRWLYEHAESHEAIRTFASGVRTPSLISGMVVCPLLALGSMGLDGLLRRPRAEHRLRLSFGSPKDQPTGELMVDHRLIAVIVAVLALSQVHSFGREWLGTMPGPGEEIEPVLAALETPDLQWVQPPYGEMFWVPTAIERGYKIAFAEWPWGLRDRPLPSPELMVSRHVEPELTRVAQIDEGLTLYAAPPGHEYAAITHQDGTRTACTALGEGGNIDVSCTASQPGVLTIQEHRAAGWSARIGDEQTSIADVGAWLTVNVPAGAVDVSFRYRPWDVPAGIVLLIVGMLLAGFWLIWPRGMRTRTSVPPAALPLIHASQALPLASVYGASASSVVGKPSAVQESGTRHICLGADAEPNRACNIR
jgi:hypothetical protein